MKLMYTLSPEDQSALDAALIEGEKLMYCVPFNIYGESFVNGYTAITDKKIYCLLNGRIVGSYELARCGEFSTEVMYGNCAFYTVYDGSTTLICRFISGRKSAMVVVRIPPSPKEVMFLTSWKEKAPK